MAGARTPHGSREGVSLAGQASVRGRRLRYSLRRRKARKPHPHQSRGVWYDAAYLALLAVGLVLTLFALLQRPLTRFAFPVDRQPPQVILRNFYGVERNEGGAYRWSKPGASLEFPFDAPGTYDITLFLQESPAVLAPRTVTLYLAGKPSGTATPGEAPQPYTTRLSLAPRDWARPEGRRVVLEMQAPAYVPPGDPRALGVILTAVRIEPVARAAPLQPALFLPPLALLTALYLGLRLLRVPAGYTALGLGLGLVAYGAFGVIDRTSALLVAYQPLEQPVSLLGLLLFLVPAPFLSRCWTRLPPATPAADPRLWSRRSWPLLPIVALAGCLRLYHSLHLSLWLDEGFTVLYAHLPWRTLLGFDGIYDIHPPLYYAATKLAGLGLDDLRAGRTISVVAGTLTIPVVYAAAARLLDRRAAAGSALVCALSPLHLWYSQEARLYALDALLVALAYLALIATAQEFRWWWILGYGCALCLAMYVGHTAAFALLPQVFPLLLIAREAPRRAAALVGAAGLAALLYLPWLRHSLAVGGTVASNRGNYFIATPAKAAQGFLAVLGLSGGSSSYWGAAPAPWVRWATLRPLLLLAVLPALALGTWALARHARAGVFVAAWLASTFGTAILISLATPAFADKTLTYAVCGWALLAGAVLTLAHPRWLRGLGIGSLVSLLLLSTAAIGAIYRGGTKQDYRGFAAATAVAARFGVPLLLDDEVAATLVGAYQPQVLAGEHLHTGQGDARIAAFLGRAAQEPGLLWFAYGEFPWAATGLYQQRIAERGFERVLHQPLPDRFFLDLYAQPGARWGGAQPRDLFADAPAQRWQLPPGAARFEPAGSGPSRLVFGGALASPPATTTETLLASPALAALTFDLAAWAGVGEVTATLTCLAAGGQPLGEQASTLPATAGAARQARLAILCPAGASHLRLGFAAGGGGVVEVSAPRLALLLPIRAHAPWELPHRAPEATRDAAPPGVSSTGGWEVSGHA